MGKERELLRVVRTNAREVSVKAMYEHTRHRDRVHIVLVLTAAHLIPAPAWKLQARSNCNGQRR